MILRNYKMNPGIAPHRLARPLPEDCGFPSLNRGVAVTVHPLEYQFNIANVAFKVAPLNPATLKPVPDFYASAISPQSQAR